MTIIPGDGTGPSLVSAAVNVLDALGCNFEYEFVDAGITALEKSGDLLPKQTLSSIEKNKIALKGPLTTPIGEGFTSINVTLRKLFHLYANLRPAVSYPGTQSRYSNVDIITIHENTGGMYSCVGHDLNEDRTEAQAISIVTREGSE